MASTVHLGWYDGSQNTGAACGALGGLFSLMRLGTVLVEPLTPSGPITFTPLPLSSAGLPNSPVVAALPSMLVLKAGIMPEA